MQRILLVGIGNIPFPRTRHSVGHYILDSIASRCGYNLSVNDRLDGYFAEGEVSLNERSVHLSLFKPKPFMNVLGAAVGKACRETVKSPSSMIVIQDTMNLEPGRLKIKLGGKPDGHRGIRSITKGVNHDSDYFRLLVGIGRAGDAKEYVLGPLSSYEKLHWSADGAGIDEVWECIETIAKRMERGQANK